MQEAHKAIMKVKKFIAYDWFSGYRTPSGLIETQFDKTTELKVFLYNNFSVTEV